MTNDKRAKAENDNDILVPLSSNDDASSHEFHQACQSVIEKGCGRVILVTPAKDPCCMLRLPERIRLQKRQRLEIVCESTSHKPTIVGNTHSLFFLDQKSQLHLHNINLHHDQSPEDVDSVQQIGAAIHVRNRAQCVVCNAEITSIAGFAVWGIQTSQLRLIHCRLYAPARSAVVGFGATTCHLEHCQIVNAGVHGICMRASGGTKPSNSCQLTLQNCQLVDHTIRALYAYGGTSLTMTDCTVQGTIRRDKAAVELCIDAPFSNVVIRNCRIKNNAGIGLLVRWQQQDRNTELCELTDNEIHENGNGDIVHLDDADDKASKQESSSNTSAIAIRSQSKTSYRWGDWWCDTCRIVIACSASACPTCQSPQGKLLTTTEIALLNRGQSSESNVLSNDDGNGTMEPLRKKESPHFTWWYDTDGGWKSYDEESRVRLEDAYQRYHCQDDDSNMLVSLDDNKYQVNLENMQQVNVVSQFPRKVQRRECES